MFLLNSLAGNMKKFIVPLLFLAAATSAVLFFWNDLSETYSKLFLGLPSHLFGGVKGLSQPQERSPLLLQEQFKERVSALAPLIFEIRLPESFLTKEGVIEWTNAQRAKYGLPLFTESPGLSLSAKTKAQDMIDFQYFSHIAPDGEGAGDLVQKAGYEFIAVGENLALGDFENDEKLVDGWMGSQGHRENILNPQYREIGVAVLQGEYQGRLTWVAVQHFAMPLSACKQPSQDILSVITKNQEQIEALFFSLAAAEAELKAFQPKHSPEYNQKVRGYNALVAEYNGLIDETKILIAQYNSQVQLFNQCAQGG